MFRNWMQSKMLWLDICGMGTTTLNKKRLGGHGFAFSGGYLIAFRAAIQVEIGVFPATEDN